MKMQKRQFRIGELAKHLGVERFVVRFWEKEFGIRTYRSDGGQRFYEEKDLEKLQLIKSLLYDKGFTIAGAKKIIKEKNSTTNIIASCKTTLDELPTTIPSSNDLKQQLIVLKQQLLRLQEMF
jgi:DNA-binding transcriptional MerR regulator